MSCVVFSGLVNCYCYVVVVCVFVVILVVSLVGG